MITHETSTQHYKIKINNYMLTLFFIILKLTGYLIISWWWIIIVILIDSVLSQRNRSNEEQIFANGFEAGKEAEEGDDYNDYF